MTEATHADTTTAAGSPAVEQHPGEDARILVIDNYDSFVYTIVGYLQQLGASTVVVRNDDVPALEDGAVDLTGFDGVLVSPGPGNPVTAGRSLDVIGACADSATPMLGVCLGHQALGHFFGATVEHSPQLMHGRTSELTHDGRSVFACAPSPMIATRYHSLSVDPDTIPDVLTVTARTADGMVMGLEHRRLPLHGVQFHPESVLTENGHLLLASFLELCDGRDAAERAEGLKPLMTAG
ncbi:MULTISPECIES: anthranilate synthase component II [Brachybacterium]|uniref:Anthranilate synthase component II n=1 Tax=Brachybacterium alimentarium TaxID=47845 RepID=A0A2A3YGX1_9MICO|nr:MULTISPECIES: gamma-glutamyl-gamma-aminobutyrate hydrolase family protein [Brachybacterium]PCC30989.1 anthranilate synthase component II [Brachybacterium alimentarium]PCC38570.1 anthranilate synthase component II [Brachybacterium alimentarium]RCS59963.1 anthranilate synthase component II [Brachybacterium sp. JB7]RCS81922.1 anthranilate synthase component II [Brachybacterium alimentarium]RCS83390.1 anthranilate synthase component II [Brachybacterium alimentarium]